MKTERFFLFVGSSTYEGPISRLKASGIPYRLKRLESKPTNWQKICDLLDEDGMAGAVVKLTSWTVSMLSSPEYTEVAEQLFTALGRGPHLVLAHEAVLTGEDGEPASEASDDELPDDWDYDRLVFGSTTPEQRRRLAELARNASVEILPYTTNAELSVLATAFVEDNESNLLFRLYVPAGRLYAEEADRLLSLFRDWLTRVKSARVRQDGYSTGSGRMYEFFAEEPLGSDLTVQFDAFSAFLDLCARDVEGAVTQLVANGMDADSAEDVVNRYARESRRLHLDLRHARENRMLQMKQRLEAELLDGGEMPVDRLLEALIPPIDGAGQALLLPTGGTHIEQMTVNQQFVQQAGGVVAQNVAGDVRLAPSAVDLLRLINQHGGADAEALTTAVYELEDEEARSSDRLRAKQRLKGFLLRIGSAVESGGLAVLQKYVENKLGL